MWKGVGENIFLMKLPHCSSFFIYLQHEEISAHKNTDICIVAVC